MTAVDAGRVTEPFIDAKDEARQAEVRTDIAQALLTIHKRPRPWCGGPRPLSSPPSGSPSRSSSTLPDDARSSDGMNPGSSLGKPNGD